MSIDLTQFHQVFFEEVREHLAEVENQLLAMDLEAVEGESLNAIFRAAHSIKGSSAIFGFSGVAEFTHHLETLLDQVRQQERPLTAGIVDLVLESVDCIRTMTEHARTGSGAEVPVADLVGRLHSVINQEPQPSLAAANTDEDFGLFTPDCANLMVSSEAETSATPQSEHDFRSGAVDDGSFGLFIPAPHDAGGDAQRRMPAAKRERDVGAVRESAKAAVDAGSIRVSIDKIDQLVNLVGELVITQSMLLQTGKAIEPTVHEKHHISLTALERNTRDLQAAVLSIRLLPVSYLFSRFRRVVRDLANQLRKDVELVVLGDHTELDKGIIERLADPLAHLVRNSIDHGIESPPARIAKGKPARGQIVLAAAHEAGSILIEITDDGNGLDRDRILKKALERGLPVSDGMSDSEIWNLIFTPGFSTAESITEVSGRGVGMDVVRRNIVELGGRIDIDSSPGQGTKFSIRVPLTLAILDGMVVSVAGEVLVIPLDSVVESVTPSANRVKLIQGRGRLLLMRGEYIPLIDGAQEFALVRAQPPESSVAVVVESEGKRVGLVVDELLGQQQVVIKNVEKNYRRIKGFAGATIMGDGSVAFIVDTGHLISHSISNGPASTGELLRG